MQTIKHSILNTLAWFDSIEFPITRQELYSCLISNTAITKKDFAQNLDELVRDKIVKTAEGHFALKNFNDEVTTRKRQYRIAERKYNKILKITKILRYIPWIKLISVCNTVGIGNAKDDSDIDIFIITQKNKIWSTRFIVVSFLKIFGLRPLLSSFGNYPEKRRDRIDASFFLDEENLSIKNLAIPQDIYLWYWTMLQTPVYDQGNYYQKFISANNWVNSYLPHISPRIVSRRRQISPLPQIFQKLIKALFSLSSEFINKKIQMFIMPSVLKKEANTSSNVVINETMLKFHHKDTRLNHRDRWLNSIKQFNK